MTDENKILRAAQVLILEDDYYLANDLEIALKAAGALIIGPFGDEMEAKSALAEAKPDCAFVDVNLGAGPSFSVPHALTEYAIPFVFVTGYDGDIIPPEFAPTSAGSRSP